MLKLDVKTMAFIVLKLFPTFVSIKIRYGFNDVTHIFSGPLHTRVTSLEKNRVKYLTLKSTEFGDMFLFLMVTSI